MARSHCAKTPGGRGRDAIAEGLTLAGVRSATTGATLTGATVSAFYSRLRRRSDGEESLPALRTRLAALEATLAQEQAEAVQALAARDQAVSAQRAAEDDAAWWKLRWKAACDEAAATKASRAEALGERDKARTEAAQEAQERAKARDQAQEAQKVLTERLAGLKSQLATAEGERDLARAEVAQAIQCRDQAWTDRTASLKAQAALTERLTTLESRLEAEQTKALLLDGCVIAFDKQKNIYHIDGLTKEQMCAVSRHWEIIQDTVAKLATEQLKKLESDLETAARHADRGDFLLRIQLCTVASDAEKDTVKGLQARNALAGSPILQAACARFAGPKQPQPPTQSRPPQRP